MMLEATKRRSGIYLRISDDREGRELGASTPHDLARVASPTAIHQIVRNMLTLQLGDQDLAADVYADLHRQVIQSPERRHHYTIAVDLAPSDETRQGRQPAMVVATVHCEYRVIPASRAMRFSCVSDQETYRELLQDYAAALVWHFKPIGDLHGGSDAAFELVQFSVDGKPRTIRRTKQARGQSYVVSLSDKQEEQAVKPASVPLTISYTYRVLVRRQGHLLYLDVGTLSMGLWVTLRYGGCGIREVATLPLSRAPNRRGSCRPPSVPTPSVEVGFDGWVLPRSGVAFVWSLEQETVNELARRNGLGVRDARRTKIGNRSHRQKAFTPLS